jgi:outer membrane biosynthesis protein TonB
VVAIAAGCTTTTRYYVPTEGEPRLTPNEVRDQSDALLGMQCPRLMGNDRFATGEARIIVELDRSGLVHKAQVTRTSGDEAMDAIFGALVARLQVDPPTGMEGDRGEHPIYIGYSCAPENNAITLNITGRANPSIPPPAMTPSSPTS